MKAHNKLHLERQGKTHREPPPLVPCTVDFEFLLYKKKTLQDAITTFPNDVYRAEMLKALEETENALKEKDTL